MATYVIIFKDVFQNVWNRELVNGKPRIEKKVLGTAKLECNPTGLFIRFRKREMIEKAWEIVREQYNPSGYGEVIVERRSLDTGELERGKVSYIQL